MQWYDIKSFAENWLINNTFAYKKNLLKRSTFYVTIEEYDVKTGQTLKLHKVHFCKKLDIMQNVGFAYSHIETEDFKLKII